VSERQNLEGRQRANQRTVATSTDTTIGITDRRLFDGDENLNESAASGFLAQPCIAVPHCARIGAKREVGPRVHTLSSATEPHIDVDAGNVVDRQRLLVATQHDAAGGRPWMTRFSDPIAATRKLFSALTVGPANANPDGRPASATGLHGAQVLQLGDRSVAVPPERTIPQTRPARFAASGRETGPATVRVEDIRLLDVTDVTKAH